MPEQIDAVPQRRRVRELAEAVRETADGEECPAEQEHRHHAEAEERVESLVALEPGGERGDRRRKGSADQDRHRPACDRQRRVNGAERRDHREVDARHDREPREDEERMAEDDVANPQGRRQLGVELPRPPDPRHHRIRRLESRDLHAHRREHPRRHVVEIRNAERMSAAVDDLAEPEPEGGQVEDGVEEARRDAATTSTSFASDTTCPRRR